MRFGFIPSEGGVRFDDALAEATLAEELGFDSVWLEEHRPGLPHNTLMAELRLLAADVIPALR
jgi:alkanesulfonate monooxygenase SsuD/methylene tetrahydromethanopterin reductase-like flavin-dependent oxidoreductase (luciferase family)